MVQRIESVDRADEEWRGPTARAGSDPTRSAKAVRTKVLVAVAVPVPRGTDAWPCVPGELVWLPPGCGDGRCACLIVFSGCASGGVTPAARVVELVGIGRSQVLRVLEAAMCPHCVSPAAAALAADRLLRTAAAHPVGTLLVRGARGVVARAIGGAA